MMPENQTEFRGWAKVEVMGHQSHTGFVETQAFGAAVLFRIDRPEIPEAEETLTQSEWVGDTRCPAGSIVKRAAIPAASVLVGAGSIYRIIPCDEATALVAIRTSERRPLLLVKLAEDRMIAAAAAIGEEDDDLFEDDDDDEEDEDRPVL
jgi:hypothetical protein